MRTIHRGATVSYAPAQMFELVNDIASYPKFLPWCKTARVLERDEHQIRATLTVAKRGLEKSFTTLNLLQRPQRIEMRLVEGPFHRLEGLWLFNPVDTGCCISLDMTFEISGKIMAMTLGPVFNHAANLLVDAFVERAHEVYGAR